MKDFSVFFFCLVNFNFVKTSEFLCAAFKDLSTKTRYANESIKGGQLIKLIKPTWQSGRIVSTAQPLLTRKL